MIKLYNLLENCNILYPELLLKILDEFLSVQIASKPSANQMAFIKLKIAKEKQRYCTFTIYDLAD